MGLTRIMETAADIVRQPVAVVQLPERQTTSIRGYLAALKIGNNFLGEKTFKAELFMAECFLRVSRLRSCLFGDFSILADTLSLFKNFS